MRTHSSAFGFLAIATLGGALLGCGEVGDEAGVESVQGDIIGGSTITIGTRRSMGLVNVNGTGCSGSLLKPDWALTASHCIDFANPTNNSANAPQSGGTIDTRPAVATIPVGTSDITLIKLGTTTPNWPQVSRTIPTADPHGLIGQNVNCYGSGMSGYKSPSGGLYDGQWRSLVKTVTSFDESLHDFVFTAAAGNTQIQGFGDSGGGCFFNNQPVGIISTGDWDCADHSTYNNCVATVTAVFNGKEPPLALHATYISQALTGRAAAPFQFLALLNNWTGAPYSTNAPAAALVESTTAGGTVQLRGSVASGSSSVLFNLPPSLRPSATVYVPTGLASAAKGRLIIDPSGDVSVQAETAFGDAQGFTSLDGVSFEKATTGHTTLALQNGWSDTIYGTRSVAVANYGGVIRFEGAMANGTSASPFTMPAGFRPNTSVYVPVDLCGAKKGRVLIEPSGAVTVMAENSFSDATCFTSFEGAFFPLNASGYTALTPLNGWTGAPFSTRVPAARNRAGIIVFEGAIRTDGSSSTAFQLPDSMIPATEVYVDADLCNAHKGRILVHTTGAVEIQSQGAFTDATCFTSLEGVQFGI